MNHALLSKTPLIGTDLKSGLNSCDNLSELSLKSTSRFKPNPLKTITLKHSEVMKDS